MTHSSHHRTISFLSTILICFLLVELGCKKDFPVKDKTSPTDLANCDCRLDSVAHGNGTYALLSYDSLNRLQRIESKYHSSGSAWFYSEFTWAGKFLTKMEHSDSSFHTLARDASGRKVVKYWERDLIWTKTMTQHQGGLDTIWWEIHYPNKEYVMAICEYKNGNMVSRINLNDRNGNGIYGEAGEHNDTIQYTYDDSRYVYCSVPNLEAPRNNKNNEITSRRYLYDQENRTRRMQYKTTDDWFFYNCD